MASPAAAQPLAIVIGASAGGLEALLDFAGRLPRNLPAVVCVVMHVGSNASVLPNLLSQRSQLQAVHARDRQPALPGAIYVAPPDRHLLLGPHELFLTRGPKENHARPAIDPLFRSAALHWGERVAGVVLSGFLDDGAAGLAAIKAGGGHAFVQDPREALQPDMPLAAMAATPVDGCLPVAGIVERLVELASGPPRTTTVRAPASLAIEHGLQTGEHSMEDLSRIGKPSSLTCPECGGGMWELGESPLRYRCHTGHAFSAGALASGQRQTAEAMLWSAVRSMHERAQLLHRMASIVRATGDEAQADVMQARAEEAQHKARTVTALLESEPAASASA